jgi:hypothetical protein
VIAAATGVEETRNRLLRRMDWRFFMPGFRPRRAVTFAAGALADATAVVCEDVLRPSAGDECDLAILEEPSPESLRAAAASLRRGGICYVEWRAALRRPIGVLRRRCVAAGLELVDCVAPWPHPARALPTLWVPLTAGGALRHFVLNGSHPRSRVERYRGIVRRALWSARGRLGLTAPAALIARRPEAPDAGARRADDPAEFVAMRWERWGLGRRPASLSSLLLTGGRRSSNKVVALVFAGRSATPRVALKLARSRESAPAVESEGHVLRALERRYGSLPGVPRCLAVETTGDGAVLAETALIGTPLSAHLGPETYRALALRGTEWLAALAAREAGSVESAARIVEPVRRAFESAYAGIADSSALAACAARLAKVGPLPVAVEQRDFSPWNLLVGPDGALQVLDWESAEARGLPALDLIYFLAYLTFYVERARTVDQYRRSYRMLLDPASARGAVFQECLRLYAARVGVPVTDIPALRLICWMLHSRSELRRQEEDAGGAPGRATLREGLFLALWEEEMDRHPAGDIAAPPRL